MIAVFLAVIFSVADVAKKQIKSESERIGRAALPREFIRIYIDDCLNDAFTRGLVLLGRQGGRIWQEQGGRVAFEENINGITLNPEETYGRYSTGRVAYGIKAEDYFQHPNAYPCDSEEHAPEFCQYEFPDTETGFGSLSLRPGSIESELSRFVRQEAVQCILNYNEANFTYSNPPEIIPGELQVGITIREGGISVNVEYPLEIRAEGGPSFALEPFHNFYSSKFKQLLDAAITFPLRWDQEFVNFKYTEDTLKDTEGFTFASRIDVGDCTLNENGTPDDTADDYFDCTRALQADKYNRLGIEMEPIEAGNGDDIFIFRAPPNEIVRAEEYEFRIARQNRPPALDYIHRNECLLPEEQQYDYLVIKDDEELGNIELTVKAKDPDEDEWVGGNIDLIPIEDGTMEELEKSSLFIERFVEGGGGTQNPDNSFSLTIQKGDPAFDDFDNGIYTIKAFARDIHDAEDWQLLRILIDRPLDVGLRIIAPYTNYHGLTYVGEGSAWLSKEDPFALIVQLPDEAALGGEASIQLKFTPSDPSSLPWEKSIELQTQYNDDAQNRFCFLFPDERECPPDIADIPDPADEDEYEPFWQYFNDEEYLIQMDPDSSLAPFIEGGTLEVRFSFPYCDAEEENSDSISIASYECLPHFNPEHQFPYMKSDPFDFYQWTFDENNQLLRGEDFQGVKNRDLNSFSATHACCKNDAIEGFTRRGPETTCFESPWPGCYGLHDLTELPADRGYVWEELAATCDGERGNVCGNPRSSLYNVRGRGLLWCGINDRAFCGAGRTPIPRECQNGPAYSLIEDVGWCTGTFGCSRITPSTAPVVYTGSEERPFFRNQQMAEYGTDNALREIGEPIIYGYADFPFHSGCNPGSAPSGDDGRWCDGDFDGRFDGKCDVNQETGAFECLDLICTPNQRRCNSDTEEEDWYICNGLGTDYSGQGRCAQTEYCGENGQCQPRICTPGEALCYSDYLTLLSSEEGGRAVRERRQAIRENLETYPDRYNEENPLDQVQREELAFVCDSRGSEAVPAVIEDEERDVIYDCGVVCGDPDVEITVVNVAPLSGPDAEEDWVCRGCTRDDWDNERPCKTFGGGGGACTDTEIGSPRYQCR